MTEKKNADTGANALDTDLADALSEISNSFASRLTGLVETAQSQIAVLDAKRESIEAQIAALRDEKRSIKAQMDVYLDGITKANALMRTGGGADVVI